MGLLTILDSKEHWRLSHTVRLVKTVVVRIVRNLTLNVDR
jgi:hypothetical protein